MGHILLAGWPNAALALDKLDDHGGGGFAHGGVKRLNSVERNVGKAIKQRGERLTILWLPGGRERAEGPAVEAAHGGDDASAPGEDASGLERAFDRLRARVAQKYSLQPGR